MATVASRPTTPNYGSAHSAAHSRSSSAAGFRSSVGLAHIGRRTLGISLLMLTVFLWTASNFMASFIFSDNTYSKPFFIVYINTSLFIISLIPRAIQFLRKNGTRGARLAAWELWEGIQQDIRDKAAGRNSQKDSGREGPDKSAEDEGGGVLRRRLNILGGHDSDGQDDDDETIVDHVAAASQRLLPDNDDEQMIGQTAGNSPGATDLEAGIGYEGATPAVASGVTSSQSGQLSFRETAWLSAEFCLLWFAANYFAVACLEFTSVASATIFTSLSSIFTLLFCAVVGVEGFTVRKLVGVVASVAGVGLVSSVDLSGQSDENRGKFPHKTPGEIAVGDSMALLSAAVYGVYVTVMKFRVGHEDRVDMALFFGLVGVFNVLFLWPGFVLLHVLGLETFELPPTGQVWSIILLNSLSSLLSDFAWAYAMLLTTPLLVTVGLSLTIPLSLVGEMIQYGQYSSATYWVGACVVVLSFLFVSNESHEAVEDTPSR